MSDISSGVLRVGNLSVPLGPKLLCSGGGDQADAGAMNVEAAEADPLAAAATEPTLPRHPAPAPAPYVLTAQATITSLTRLLRAMQSPRPILLEGPPGVGKSSIIAHLAALAGHALVRINLSEHSELSDLLGTDLPAPDGEADTASNSNSSSSSSSRSDGSDDTSTSTPSAQKAKSKPPSGSGSNAQFRWCDGVFLTAMKRGEWVLLDEMNLAPQPVLEGLNACLDHRREVFLPEIGQTVRPGPGFRVFCAQVG